MYCPALVDKSKAGQGTLVSISRNIIHRTKAAALVTKSYSNQDKGLISLLLTVGEISCNVQSLARRGSLYSEGVRSELLHGEDRGKNGGGQIGSIEGGLLVTGLQLGSTLRLTKSVLTWHGLAVRDSQELSAVFQELSVVCQEMSAVCQELSAVCQELSAVCQELSAVSQELSAVHQELSAVCQEVSAAVCQELSAVSQELSAVGQEMSAVCQELSAVCQELSAVCQELSAVCQELSAVCQELSAGESCCKLVHSVNKQ